MKALFVRESGSGFLLLALAIMSLLLIVLDRTTKFLEPTRNIISTLVSPLYYVAETPYMLSDEAADVVASQNQLLDEVKRLEGRVLQLSQVSQQYKSLLTENGRLRELLGSQARLSDEVLIAELIGILPNPGMHQVIIDKGTREGVAVGDAVIDAEGLFGQVVGVNLFDARILLVSDASHAVPVEVDRNGVRSIAAGNGSYDYLELENVPVTADIREGDALMSSGLGDRFPRGYPVAVVESVIRDPSEAFSRVTARPAAHLTRSRHLLVVLSTEDEETTESVPDATEQESAP